MRKSNDVTDVMHMAESNDQCIKSGHYVPGLADGREYQESRQKVGEAKVKGIGAVEELGRDFGDTSGQQKVSRNRLIRSPTVNYRANLDSNLKGCSNKENEDIR